MSDVFVLESEEVIVHKTGQAEEKCWSNNLLTFQIRIEHNSDDMECWRKVRCKTNLKE